MNQISFVLRTILYDTYCLRKTWRVPDLNLEIRGLDILILQKLKYSLSWEDIENHKNWEAVFKLLYSKIILNAARLSSLFNSMYGALMQTVNYADVSSLFQLFYFGKCKLGLLIFKIKVRQNQLFTNLETRQTAIVNCLSYHFLLFQSRNLVFPKLSYNVDTKSHYGGGL